MPSDVEQHDSTRLKENSHAPGRPGVKPTWSSGAKTAVGTPLAPESRIWFTIRSGILDEIYFPDIDSANTQSIRFLVADGKSFFSDEEHDTEHAIQWIRPGVPAFQLSNTCKQGRYQIEKEVLADPARDVLLLNTRFETGRQPEPLHLFFVVNPNVGDRGEENEAWVGQYKGIPMLFAGRNGLALAVASSGGFVGMSCGFVGTSDGMTDIRTHKRMTRFYTEAFKGNVCLTGEIDWRSCQGRFRIALGCGGSGAEAGQNARAGLLEDFADLRRKYVEGWNAVQTQRTDMGHSSAASLDLYPVSVAVMRTHESKRFPGGFVASLSIPWGEDRDDKTSGGYHVVWPRDMCETVLGLLACGDATSAQRALFYLQCTQEQDGNWSQNMWLDGTAYWTATQMDGTSFSVLVADALRRSNQLGLCKPWPMIQRAAGFLVQNGPITEQDRWEANPGYSPYTMAVEIAALLAAADFAELESQNDMAQFLRATADAWNDSIDELTYVSGTKLAKKFGVEGYYFRILPPEGMRAASIESVTTELKNHAKGDRKHRAVDIVSPDALALVRFGLRAADNAKILNTVKVIDATLKTCTATGPVWHRYTFDGYGEHSDGKPFDKRGKGRGWPLLTGERAHYEIARGNFEEARNLKAAIEAQTSECGMIPEQIWDAPDIPKRHLFNGHPSGSGMPLVWAHAEYVKLLRSLKEERVWSMPPQTKERYLIKKQTSPYQIWTPTQQRARVTAGKNLRIDSADAVAVHWTLDGGKTAHETMTTDSGLGVRWAVVPISESKPGARLQFALEAPRQARGRGRTFEIKVQTDRD
jgi:glucoamylase